MKDRSAIPPDTAADSRPGLDPVRRNTYLLLSVFWLTALGVAFAGYLYYRHQKEAIASEERLQLATIATLKVRQVSDWRNERIADARVIAGSPLSPAVQSFLVGGHLSRDDERDISAWLETIRSASGYANVILANPSRKTWIAVGNSTNSSVAYFVMAQDVMQRDDVVLTDFHRDDGLRGPHLGLNVPLRLGPQQKPVGALLMGIDPNAFLYPLIQAWPTASRTAETLLARREGNEVVYLNELRHRKGTALRLRLPLQSQNLPAARGADGFEGILTGVDYRGIPVLAAIRKVPDSPWILVAKIDLQEVHEPIEQQTLWLGLIGCSMLLTIGAGVTFILRDLRARFDIQQYRARLEQRALRGHYDYLSKYANDIILLTDDKGLIAEANDRALNSYGYTREELVGMPLRQLRAPETLREFEQDWQLTDLQESVIYETRHRCRDARTFPVEVSTRRVTVDHTVFRQSIIRDISERREAELERVHLQEQLQQAQRMESIGRLAGGVAHDFNNLLTVINGYGAMVMDALPSDNPLHGEVHEICAAGERAAGLTRQLLAFSRKQVIAPKILNLNTIVNDLVKLLRRLVGEDVNIIMDLSPELHPVFVDPGQMEQVLMNLATNARDAMPHGGELIVRTSNVDVDGDYASSHIEARTGAHVLLVVSDTGAGMPAETLCHAFEPFFTTKPRGQGTGLGLATVYGAIKQARGWIALYSELGKGTTFNIYLPRADAAASAGTGGEAENSSVRDGRGTETVLLVEDQAEVRKLAVEALRRYGYHVLEAANGHEALALCRTATEEIHLIITDIVMPGITGPELADQAVGANPTVKVLYMSGYAEKVIAHQRILDSGLPYLQKPFTPGGLARKTREVLDSSKA
jgi:PAS domain S-box-containing protein